MHIFYMKQQAGSDPGEWGSIFIEASISVNSTKLYTQTLLSEKLTKDSLPTLDHSMLKELGIKTVGEMFAILKLIKRPPLSPPSLANTSLNKSQA